MANVAKALKEAMSTPNRTPTGQLIEMGQITTLDADGTKHGYKMALVIGFSSVEEIRRAIKYGHCRFPGDAPTKDSMDSRKLATILAALRYWQREGLAAGGHEHDIASDGGVLTPLTYDEINALCEEINT